jgi:hypothetical protein
MIRRRARGGLMLVQMLITLGLMGAFAVVADRVFVLSIKTASKAAKEQEELIRLEQAIGVLRADLWSAAKVEVPDKMRLRITGKDAGPAEWKTGAAGELIRLQDKEQRRWTGSNFEFERHDSLIVVRRQGAEVALLRSPRAGGP